MGLTTTTGSRTPLTPTYQLQLKVSQITALSQEVLMGIDLISCDCVAMSLGKGCMPSPSPEPLAVAVLMMDTTAS